jgi:hypothetical protein
LVWLGIFAFGFMGKDQIKAGNTNDSMEAFSGYLVNLCLK